MTGMRAATSEPTGGSITDTTKGPTPDIHMTGALEPRSSWGSPGQRCPVARTLDAIGTKSTFVLLREAFYGATRFEEFVNRTELSEPVVASRLREMTGEGLLERVPYQEPGKRSRSGYKLTEKGAELLPVLVAMSQWGSRWTSHEGSSRTELAHTGCGSPVYATLRCEAGHEVHAGELDLRSTRGQADAPGRLAATRQAHGSSPRP
jgi:DNA-binding HxlR family transcriptional regulator